MRTCYYLSICVILSGCVDNQKVVLSADKMEKIMWELTQADVFTQEFIAKDSSKDLEKENLKLQLRIFDRNNTDRKSFYKSYDYYVKHEELLKPLLDTMIARNGRIRENMRLKRTIKAANGQIK